MPDQSQPQLGYGKPSEATIDQVNIWMRSTPWYQQQMKAWGQDPGHPTLTKSQSQQILQQAQANGVVVDQGGMEVDDHGNFNPKGHKLRNTLIVIGIAAATIGTMGAAGVFAGAGGTGMAGGAAGAGASGLGGAGAAGLGYGTVGLGAGGLGGAAAAGGGALVGGGTAAGLGAAALAGPSGLGAGGAAVGGGTAASGGGAGLLASSATVPGATAALPTGLASGSSAGALTGGGSSSTMGGLGRSIFNYATGGGGGGGVGTNGIANAAIPVAGNLISGYLQSRAAGQASDAQQRYLEEALAYQKEQDAFNRTRQTGLDAQDQARWVANQTRQTGLDAQDVARYGYTTAQDAAKYGDTQQEYLANFARDENRYGYKTDLEASRYGDYSKRIAPYLASGASANDRMASLLGLPKGAAFDPRLTAGPTRQVSAPPTLSDPGTGFGGWSGGGGSSTPGTGENFDPAFIGQQLDRIYAQHGVSATGPGTGPTDRAYFIDAIRKNKGWDPVYWEPRLAQELKQAGVGN